jgi:hypothetical protein
MANYFTIPESLAGKSLRDLAGVYNFRSDLVANLLGIPETQRLTAGQEVTASGFDPGSSEGRFLTSTLKSISPEERATQQALASAEKIRQYNIESAQPAIQTLTTGKTDLKSRYDELLASIRARGEQEVKHADITSAQELGRRGISTSSTFAGEFQQGKRLDVQSAIDLASAQTAAQAAEKDAAINNAIASLQAGAGPEGLAAALNILQNAQQQQQFEASQALSRESLAQNKELTLKGLESPTKETPYIPSLTNIGGKGYYYDPASGTFKTVGGNSFSQLQSQFNPDQWE